MRDHQPSLPGLNRVACQDRAQPRTDRKSHRGADVIAHGCSEARCQCHPSLQGQRDAMRHGRGPHDHGPDQRQDPLIPHHAGNHRDDADIQGDQPDGLPAPRSVSCAAPQ